MELWTALTIGALGSFHCVGMCGPIAFALPLDRSTRATQWLGSFTYNSGRIMTYALMGAVFGLLGRGFMLIGTQQWVSVLLGALIVLSVAIPTAVKYRMSPHSGIARAIGQVKRQMGLLLGKKSYKSLLLIGFLNGFLPCGLVYLAIAGAMATGNGLEGAAFMALFGMGTLPIMAITAVLGNLVSLRIRNLVRRSMPVIVLCIGLLFIVRGLNLGIPYISPKVEANQVVNCCAD